MSVCLDRLTLGPLQAFDIVPRGIFITMAQKCSNSVSWCADSLLHRGKESAGIIARGIGLVPAQ